jgi:hypothetical protein
MKTTSITLKYIQLNKLVAKDGNAAIAISNLETYLEQLRDECDVANPGRKNWINADVRSLRDALAFIRAQEAAVEKVAAEMGCANSDCSVGTYNHAGECQPKPVMKFRFNTGRQYQPKGHQFAGQLIEVEVTDHPTKPGTQLVKFWDHSRGLDYGFITQAWARSQREIQDLLMYQYDHNLCISHWELDRRVTTGEI